MDAHIHKACTVYPLVPYPLMRTFTRHVRYTPYPLMGTRCVEAKAYGTREGTCPLGGMPNSSQRQQQQGGGGAGEGRRGAARARRHTYADMHCAHACKEGTDTTAQATQTLTPSPIAG